MIPTVYATKNRTLKYIAKVDKTESDIFEYPSFNNWQKKTVENKQGFSRVEQLY